MAGSSRWSNYGLVRSTLDPLGVTALAHGACPRGGADWLGERWALERGVPHVRFEAEWERLGGAAGPVRNRVMHHQFRPDLVVAFKDGFNSSSGGGTEDMVSVARNAGTRWMLVTSSGVVVEEEQLSLFGEGER